MTIRFSAAPNGRVQARRLAAQIAHELNTAIALRGRASIAVPGGDTPGPLFDALARQPVNWSRVTVMLNDERWVPRTDAGSNERQIRKRFLVAQARAARYLAMKTSSANPQAALGLVTDRVQRRIGRLDVCVLGMGGDGHTASLFPHAMTTLASRRALLAVEAPGARGAAARLSLTLKTILAARDVIVFIKGEEKRAALAKHTAPNAAPTPIRVLLARRRGPLTISWAP